MLPSINVEKPKIAEVEGVKCHCCICVRKNFLLKWVKTVSFIRAFTPF